jgi:predicted transcriptional regulator
MSRYFSVGKYQFYIYIYMFRKSKTIKSKKKGGGKAKSNESNRSNKTIRRLEKIYESLKDFNKSRVPTLQQFKKLDAKHGELMSIVKETENPEKMVKTYDRYELEEIGDLLEKIHKSINDLPNTENSPKMTESNA